jgi:hypothetical protein
LSLLVCCLVSSQKGCHVADFAEDFSEAGDLVPEVEKRLPLSRYAAHVSGGMVETDPALREANRVAILECNVEPIGVGGVVGQQQSGRGAPGADLGHKFVDERGH